MKSERRIERIVHTNLIQANLVLCDHFRQWVDVSLRLRNGFSSGQRIWDCFLFYLLVLRRSVRDVASRAALLKRAM